MIKPAVIDLSHHNIIPEGLKPAKDSGILGIIHKATEGVTYKDPTCAARLYLAKQAGMKFGTYHFMRPGDPGDQVAFYYDTVQSIQSQAGDSQDWLWACDFEADGISLDQVLSFMEQLEIVTHQSPVLYSGHSLKDALKVKPDTRLSKYRLWLAQYASSPTLPVGWTKYFLWQYSDKGSVTGISPPTDVNAYDGNADTLLAEWSGTSAQPKPEPSDKLVKIGINAPTDVQIELWLNDKVVYES
jgi:lysozyme